MTPLVDARGIAIPGRLDATDLRIESGALIGLIGPNGSGKTSLLRGLAGVEDSLGSVQIDGETVADAPPARRSRLVGFVPASRDMAWPISVRDAVQLGPAAPAPARRDAALAQFELLPLADRPVSHLSTGERTRVLLARVLALEPNVLLLDEPFAHLDPFWVLRLLDLLRQQLASGRCAAAVSLHDLSLAECCDRLVLMQGGRMIACGQPQEILAGADCEAAFRVRRQDGRWSIRPADPQSSR